MTERSRNDGLTLSTGYDGARRRRARPCLAALDAPMRLAKAAKAYARAARSENTAARLRRRLATVFLLAAPPGVLTTCRPIRKPLGCISPPAPTGGRGDRFVARWSGASRGFAGAIASSANRWTRATVTSRPCSPGSAARMADRPSQKEAIFADDLLAMLATLDNDLRGLRDRAILAIGFAGGLRRSEIVGLDCGPNQIRGRERLDRDFSAPARHPAQRRRRAADHQRQDRLARGRDRSRLSPRHLPGRSARDLDAARPRSVMGRSFRPIARKNGGVSAERLTDKHVARLVQKTALQAGIRGDLSEGERKRAFGGHSLRAGLASSAQIEEAHVQKHLGHASAEMTRRYQRKRDRFKVNLTKAAGL